MKKSEHLDSWLAQGTSRLDVRHGRLTFEGAMSRVAAVLDAEASPARRGPFRPIAIGPESLSVEAAWLSTVFVDGPTRQGRLRRALEALVAPHRLDEAVRHLEWVCDPVGQWSEKEKRAALRTAHNFMRFDAARTPTLIVIDASQLTGRRADALSAAFAALEDAPVRVLLAHDGPLIDVLEPIAASVSVALTPSLAASGSTGSTQPTVGSASQGNGEASSDARRGRRGDEATRAVRVGAEHAAPTSPTARLVATPDSPPRGEPYLESKSPILTTQSETRETTERSLPPWGASGPNVSWAAVVWATGGVSWPPLIDDVTGSPGLTASLVASGALVSRAAHVLAGEAAVAFSGDRKSVV